MIRLNRSRSINKKGFTLLEVLFVCTLIATIGTLGMVTFASDRGESLFQQMIVNINDLDRRARQWAQSGKTVVMGVSNETLQLVDGETAEALSSMVLPKSSELRFDIFATASNTTDKVIFSKTGTAQHYKFTFRLGHRMQTNAINGATGWITTETK